MVEMVLCFYVGVFEKYVVVNLEVFCFFVDLMFFCEVDGFCDWYLDQFILFGMVEQNMMSFVGGFGFVGFWFFLYMFGVFFYCWFYDQLMVLVVYLCCKVCFMGFLLGIIMFGGMMYQVIEDIFVMWFILNMMILEMGDVIEVESICEVVDSIDGLVYCCVLCGLVLCLFDMLIKVGEMCELVYGVDVLIVIVGIIIEEVLCVCGVLEVVGVLVCYLYFYIIKFFDVKVLFDYIGLVCYGVVMLENYVIEGGIGLLVVEIMVDVGVGKRFVRLGFKDIYVYGGFKFYFMCFYGFDVLVLMCGVESLIGQLLNISEGDFDVVCIDVVYLFVKVEVL